MNIVIKLLSKCFISKLQISVALRPHQKSFFVQWVTAQKIKTSNMWSTQTQMRHLHNHLFPQRLKGHLRKWAERIRTRSGGLHWNSLLDMAGPLHSGASSSSVCLYNTCTKSRPSTSHHKVGKSSQAPTTNWGITDSWWFLGEGKSVLCRSVAPGKMASQQRLSYTHKHKGGTNRTH